MMTAKMATLAERVNAFVFDPPGARHGMEQENLDAARLSFPAQLVVLIVTTIVAVFGSVWATQAGLKSDVRDIVTRMEAQREIDAERSAAVRESLDAFKRRQELQQYEIQELKEAILQVQTLRSGQ